MAAGLLTASAKAQSFNVLYNFAGGLNDGAGPTGSLVDVGGVLYGMTPGGGSNKDGTIFSYNVGTGIETLNYSFVGYPNDAAVPFGSLTPSAGNNSILYGMTEAGGSTGGGAIIEFDTSTNSESVLGSFDTPNLSAPQGSLIQSGSTLFGLAGNIFSFNLDTGAIYQLYQFEGRPDAAPGPQGSLTLLGSVLYGLSGDGGANGDGAIFSYNLTTNIENVIYSFKGGADGDEPLGSLTIVGHILYGTTAAGGEVGTIFSYDLDTDQETVLVSNVGAPSGSLIYSNGDLYGTSDFGDVYQYDIATGAFDILHKFDGKDGAQPGDLTLVGSTLFGMTRVGGANDDGDIYSITLPEPASTSMVFIALGGLLLRRR